MKHLFIGSFFVANTVFTFAQNVGIGTTDPHASAQLEISSTSRGLLIPRLTTSQRAGIAAPASGLMVYDTDLNGFWFYNGTVWASVGNTATSPWTANGNNIYNSNTGNVGIGTTTPLARLTVDSSIMVDEANSNQGFLHRSSLYFGSDKKTGILRSFLTGSAGRNGLSFFVTGSRRMTIDSTGQVGIGTVNPVQLLHVNGNTYLAGNLGIGSSTPDYAFENLWGYNYMFYGLGIGALPSSSYLLDVGSSLPSRIQGALTVNGAFTLNDNAVINGSAEVDGTLSVNNGKGVAYNGNSGSNLRIFSFTTASLPAVLGPHDISEEGAISFNGGFASTPRVFVGDIESTGGTVGQLYMVQLQLYACTTSSGITTCKTRLINTNDNSVNYSTRWNCIALGN